MNAKKRIILYLPYVIIGLYASKLPQAWRMAAGANASEKLLNIMGGLERAFASPLPSFHLYDQMIGLLLGALLRLAVYLKGKNAKKYRHN